MRALKSWISGSIALALGSLAATAQPNQFCQIFSDTMDSDALYVANCKDSANCLQKVMTDFSGNALLQGVDGQRHKLKKAQSYNFLFKTLPGGMRNSLVVIQVKQMDVQMRNQPSDVRLQRYALNFGCFRRQTNVPLPQWPPEDVHNLPSVPYDSYDEFHRNGFTSSDEDRRLRAFHVRYFNGSTCVSTLEPVRRAQFLIHDPQHYAGRTGTFFAHLGVYTTPANAQELDAVRKYEKLKIIVSNYSRPDLREGCFAFSTRAGGPKSTRLDLVVRDIERQVQAVQQDWSNDTTHTWSFELE